MVWGCPVCIWDATRSQQHTLPQCTADCKLSRGSWRCQSVCPTFLGPFDLREDSQTVANVTERAGLASSRKPRISLIHEQNFHWSPFYFFYLALTFCIFSFNFILFRFVLAISPPVIVTEIKARSVLLSMQCHCTSKSLDSARTAAAVRILSMQCHCTCSMIVKALSWFHYLLKHKLFWHQCCFVSLSEPWVGLESWYLFLEKLNLTRLITYFHFSFICFLNEWQSNKILMWHCFDSHGQKIWQWIKSTYMNLISLKSPLLTSPPDPPVLLAPSVPLLSHNFCFHCHFPCRCWWSLLGTYSALYSGIMPFASTSTMLHSGMRCPHGCLSTTTTDVGTWDQHLVWGWWPLCSHMVMAAQLQWSTNSGQNHNTSSAQFLWSHPQLGSTYFEKHCCCPFWICTFMHKRQQLNDWCWHGTQMSAENWLKWSLDGHQDRQVHQTDWHNFSLFQWHNCNLFFWKSLSQIELFAIAHWVNVWLQGSEDINFHPTLCLFRVGGTGLSFIYLIKAKISSGVQIRRVGNKFIGPINGKWDPLQGSWDLAFQLGPGGLIFGYVVDVSLDLHAHIQASLGGSKMTSFLLYKAPFSRYGHFCVFVLKNSQNDFSKWS